jgi:hypothetical protein
MAADPQKLLMELQAIYNKQDKVLSLLGKEVKGDKKLGPIVADAAKLSAKFGSAIKDLGKMMK